MPARARCCCLRSRRGFLADPVLFDEQSVPVYPDLCPACRRIEAALPPMPALLVALESGGAMTV